jgi:hypothetical protein
LALQIGQLKLGKVIAIFFGVFALLVALLIFAKMQPAQALEIGPPAAAQVSFMPPAGIFLGQ